MCLLVSQTRRVTLKGFFFVFVFPETTQYLRIRGKTSQSSFFKGSCLRSVNNDWNTREGRLERHLRAKQGFDGNSRDVWHASCPLSLDTRTTAYKVKAVWRLDMPHRNSFLPRFTLFLKKKWHLVLQMLYYTTILKTTWCIKGWRWVKQRIDGNIHEVLYDMQALVFLLGQKNKNSIASKRWRLSGGKDCHVRGR